MSWSRRGVLALVAVPLAGCGFRPVHAPGGAGTGLRGRLRLSAPDSRAGFTLNARLEDRLGRAPAATHALSTRIDIAPPDRSLPRGPNTAPRGMTGTLGFSVSDLATGAEVQSGTLSNFVTYPAPVSPVALDAARRDAEDRLMTVLADQLVTRLIAGAPGWP